MNTNAQHLAITEAVIRIQLGERSLILCSDGLWEMVRDNVVGDIVLKANNAQTACARLVKATNNSGDVTISPSSQSN